MDIPQRTSPQQLSVVLQQISKRLAAWKRERDAMSTEIQQIVSTANSMLEDLGAYGGTSSVVKRTRSRGRGGRPRGFRVSDETKARLRAAWKRRKDAAKR